MLSFRSFSIRSRLYAQIFMALFGFATVLVISYTLSSRFRVGGPLYERLMTRRAVVGEIQPSNLTVIDPALTLSLIQSTNDAAEVQRMQELYRKQELVFRERQDHWKNALYDGPVKESLERDLYPTADEFLKAANDDYLPAINRGDRPAATLVFNDKLRPLYLKHRKAVEKCVEIGLARMESDEADIADEIANGRVFLVCSIALIGLGLATIKWFLVRDITKSVSVLMARVKELSTGAADLTARIPVESKDELGQLAEGINAMIAKIHSVVSKVRESSLQVLSAASEIAATARQQESTVNGLSAASTQVAAAVREISATGKELSGTMDDVNGKANQAASIAAAGRDRLVGMERTMHQLVDSTGSISTKLATIREKADNINMVVTTITKVADQTNLLSINAAIEAEKAGEFGRGFLVVAREIRRLADQTAVATLDIENIVRLMQEAVAAGVMQMDKFSDEVRTSVTRVAEINGQTGQIIAEVSGLSDRFKQVNEGMRNQSVGAGQINEAMVSMTGDIRHTKAALEEFNAATTHLRTSIEQLNSEIGSFKV